MNQHQGKLYSKELDLSCSISSFQDALLLSKSLIRYSKLAYLNLSKNRLKADSLLPISLSLQSNGSLQYLDLSCNQLEIDKSNAIEFILKSNPSLISINLFKNNVGSEGCIRLGQLLKTGFCQIQILNLSFNNISDEAAEHLFTALPYCKLKSLVLSNNIITGVSLIELCQVIKSYKINLTSLDLSDNIIDSHEGCLILAETLAITSQLSTLNLSRNKLSNEFFSQLMFALNVNNTLQDLQASNTTNLLVDPANFSCNFQFLETNRNLRLLDLSFCVFSPETISSFSKNLRKNEILLELNLSYTNISNDSCIYLCESLTTNNSLKCLLLSGNSIGNSGGAAFAEVIRVNISLTKVDLSCNFMEDSTASSIIQSLCLNITLAWLNLHMNLYSRNNRLFKATATLLEKRNPIIFLKIAD